MPAYTKQEQSGVFMALWFTMELTPIFGIVASALGRFECSVKYYALSPTVQLWAAVNDGQGAYVLKLDH